MHQWICLDELYKPIESFFLNFKLAFELLTEKNIQKDSEASILIISYDVDVSSCASFRV